MYKSLDKVRNATNQKQYEALLLFSFSSKPITPTQLNNNKKCLTLNSTLQINDIF